MSPVFRAGPLVALLALLAGCVDGQPQAVESPASSPVPTAVIGIPWNVGDYWVQRVYYEDTPDETLHTIDYFIETIETVNGEAAFRVLSDESNRTYWVRTTDGALLRETYGEHEMTYPQPCQAFFPRKDEGTSLDHACLRVGTQASNELPNGSRALRTTVGGVEAVDVPAGRFEAVRLETNESGANVLTELYADLACFPVKVHAGLDGRPLVIDLIQYSCAARRP